MSVLDQEELEAPVAPKMGLRERNKQLMRARILTAAWLLFERDGVAATSMDGIAELAEVSDSTVHNYFRTKDDLVDAFLAECIGVRQLVALLDERPAAEPPIRAFRNLIATGSSTEEDLQSQRRLLRRSRLDKLLWGAHLRLLDDVATELAEAFRRRAPHWDVGVELMAARGLVATVVTVLELLSDQATVATWKRDLDTALMRLEACWDR